jgi:nicrotizing toxin Mtb-like protein
MRTAHRILLALVAWLMLVAGVGTAVAQASPLPGSPVTFTSHPVPPVNSPPAICPADQIPGSFTELPTTSLQIYYRADPRLGPAVLPRTGAVGELLHEYRRLDSFTATRFIDCFWDPNANMGNGGWRYPRNNGFADGFARFQMVPGQVIDRFGGNGGSFFSPFGSPFEERALPPSSLDTIDPAYPFGYHVFRVRQSFIVEAGIAAPWFGQPGGGLQYHSSVNANALLAGGFLQPLN